MAGTDLELLGPGMPEPGMSPFGGRLKQLQERYAELDAAAAAEPDAMRREQLLSQRDAIESESLQTDMAMNAPPPATVGAGPAPQPPAAPAPGAGYGQGAGMSDLPVPTMNQFVAMSGGMGSPGNPGAARAASRELQQARTDRRASYGQQVQAVEGQGDLAEVAGQGQAAVINQSMQDLAAQEQQHQERLAQHERDKADALRIARGAEDDFERERAAQGKSVEETWGEGRKIAAAIAMAMGAFGAAINGGPNHAAEIITARINREVEARRDRLGARREQASMADRHYQRLVSELGSIEAADAASKAHLLRVSAGKAEELGALAHGQEGKLQAQQVAGALKGQAAAEDEKAAEAKLKAARPTMGANMGKLYGQYLDILSKHQKLRKDEADARKAAGESANDFLDSDARKQINMLDAAEEKLNQLEKQALAIKAAGNHYIPGAEPVTAQPFTRLGRAVGGALGVGGYGPSGLDTAEAAMVSDMEMFAVADYFAQGKNAANLQAEYGRAYNSVVGNGTMDGLLGQLRAKRELYKAQRAAVTRKNTPELRQEQYDRHQANQPTIPEPGGYFTPAGGRPRGAAR